MAKKILKAIVPVVATVVGTAVGGPVGGAIGSAVATKATGGSWGQSLLAGAGSYLGGSLAAGTGNTLGGAASGLGVDLGLGVGPPTAGNLLGNIANVSLGQVGGAMAGSALASGFGAQALGLGSEQQAEALPSVPGAVAYQPAPASGGAAVPTPSVSGAVAGQSQQAGIPSPYTGPATAAGDSMEAKLPAGVSYVLPVRDANTGQTSYRGVGADVASRYARRGSWSSFV